MAEAMGMLTSAMGYLAGVDFPGLAGAEIADALRILERADAVEAVVRGKLVTTPARDPTTRRHQRAPPSPRTGQHRTTAKQPAPEPELKR
jgi:hypothetical protein